MDVGTVNAVLNSTPVHDGHFISPMADACAKRWEQVYTDGSVRFPTCQALRYGGAGILVSQRVADEEPEGEFRAFTLGGGPGARGYLVPHWGTFVSSTRMETLAILVSLLLPATLEVVTDSMACVHRFRALTARLQREQAELPPLARLVGSLSLGPCVSLRWHNPAFALAPDGDLWSHIEQLLRRRGVGSCLLRKVKSHCDEEDVARHLISEHDRSSNARADDLANEARDALHPFRKSLSEHWHARRVQTLDIMRAMHAMMVDILRSSSALRKSGCAIEASVRMRKRLVPAQALRPPPSQCRDHQSSA
eukprot:15451091-Alexandrium_andersonii.AAC.1